VLNKTVQTDLNGKIYKDMEVFMKFANSKSKRFLTGLMGILTLITFISLMGCENQTIDDSSDSQVALELSMTADGIIPAEGMMKSVTGGAGSTPANSTNVPVEANVSVAFDADINVSTLNTTTFKVTRTDTGEILAGTVTYANRIATFIPTRVFVYDTVKKSKIRKGLKQDTTYTVTIAAASIYSTSGTPQGTANYTLTFKTTNLDYGFFFLGSNGEYQKAVPGQYNPYYDESKPTIIYYHGWQKDSTKNEDFGNDNAFFFNSPTIGAYNAIGSWRNKGYNVCIAYWAQWADESEVKDAQAKLWLGNNGKKQMRYMVRGGTYVSLSTTYSVTDLLYEEYTDIFQNSVSGIRFMGHSLGNQLATLMAYKISKGVAAGSVSGNLMPKRVSLLDPFWGKGSETYSGGVYPGAKCVTYMKEMLARDAFALEEIRTNSNIGGFVGDSCTDMRKLSAYYCPWPSFGDDTAKHLYAYNWYALSVGKVVYADKTPGSGGLGAAASDAQIKATMNWDFNTKAVKSTQYKYQINAGKTTVTPADDTFTQSSGV
jgi:hypothetical protein